ncbi:MAG: glycosyltransferase family 4 protein [Candidatus Scalindua sp.]
MRLLLVTFVLDETHPALAWQVFVVRELSKKVEQLYVLTSRIGETGSLPSNVEITVPPVRPLGIPHRFGGRWAFNLDMYRYCKENRIDSVFVHMAMEWAYILYPAFKLLKLPVVMWYAHGSVTRRLQLAIKCVDRVVTSTPEGCRVNDKRISVIGQAINTSYFNIKSERVLKNILYVGRISERKRVQLLYQVHKELHRSGKDTGKFNFDIVGAPLNEDDLSYESGIRSSLWKDGNEHSFKMHGLVPYEKIPDFYETAFLHINVSETGSMDKTVMEALASGCPVLTSNTAFFELLKDYPEFLIEDDRPEAIAEKVRYIFQKREQYNPLKLRILVQDGHDLDSYADRVLNVIKKVGWT